MSVDANNSAEEKLTLRNQQNQCKVRLFKKLAKKSSAEMLSHFESNAQALFNQAEPYLLSNGFVIDTLITKHKEHACDHLYAMESSIFLYNGKRNTTTVR